MILGKDPPKDPFPLLEEYRTTLQARSQDLKTQRFMGLSQKQSHESLAQLKQTYRSIGLHPPESTTEFDE